MKTKLKSIIDWN